MSIKIIINKKKFIYLKFWDFIAKFSEIFFLAHSVCLVYSCVNREIMCKCHVISGENRFVIQCLSFAMKK